MNWLQTNNLQKMSVKAEIKKDAVAKTSTVNLLKSYANRKAMLI